MFIEIGKETTTMPSGKKEKITYINKNLIAKITIERSPNFDTFTFISFSGETLLSRAFNKKGDIDPEGLKEMEALATQLLKS